MRLNEFCIKVRVSIHLSDAFPIQNGLTQGDALSSLLYNFIIIALQLSFRIRHQEDPRRKGGLELNGTHQLLVCAGDVNLLGENINIIEKYRSSVRCS
jgi:hypothetical protein